MTTTVETLSDADLARLLVGQPRVALFGTTGVVVMSADGQIITSPREAAQIQGLIPREDPGRA